MKQILLLFAFVLTSGFVTAQDAAAKKSCAATCAKTCEKSKASASAEGTTKVASAMSAADLVAAEDESIQKRVCDITGSVSYFKKGTCEQTGSVKMTEVQFDETSNAFVNVSPLDAMSSKDAKVVKAADVSSDAASTKDGKTKACCAGKKACTKKEGA